MRSSTNEMFGTRRIASERGAEQARRALSDLFLPVEFPSVKPTSAIGLTLNAVTVGRITCGFMQLEGAVRIDTAEAQNYHVDIPTSGAATMRAALGAPVYGTPRTAAVFMPGRPAVLDCSERFSQLALMIPRDELQLELENLLGEHPAHALEFGAELCLTSEGGQSLMHALRMIDCAASQPNGALAHPLAARQLEQTLIQTLLFAQPHNYSEAMAVPAPSAGTQPVAKATELLRSDPGRPWSVAEVAAAVAVSVRSLQEGFRRSLDTTPMAYLRQLRLEKVRHELIAAEPGTVSVTEVATRWGFVHLGRFSAAYARAFGEQPSTTLRS